MVTVTMGEKEAAKILDIAKRYTHQLAMKLNEEMTNDARARIQAELATARNIAVTFSKI